MIPDFLRRENANEISELDKRITEAMVRYHKQFPADGLMTESWSWPCEAWPDIIEQCIIDVYKRQPLDPVNALLSFAYSLLANDCASALEAVGLDAYVGFLHRDRPGRTSLALDLMEELRPCLADRFVLSCINNRKFSEKDFERMDSGAVLLTDQARRIFLKSWQEKKRDVITHPYLGEKVHWGLVPYVQSLLLARCLRGDLDGYPPFFWK